MPPCGHIYTLLSIYSKLFRKVTHHMWRRFVIPLGLIVAVQFLSNRPLDSRLATSGQTSVQVAQVTPEQRRAIDDMWKRLDELQRQWAALSKNGLPSQIGGPASPPPTKEEAEALRKSEARRRFESLRKQEMKREIRDTLQQKR